MERINEENIIFKDLEQLICLQNTVKSQMNIFLYHLLKYFILYCVVGAKMSKRISTNNKLCLR